jgi:hypothetical protein
MLAAKGAHKDAHCNSSLNAMITDATVIDQFASL